MWDTYYAPRTLVEALDLLAQYGDQCRLIAGGTDLILELERGVRQQRILVDISRLPGLDRIGYFPPERGYPGTDFPGVQREGTVVIGALATHNQVVASPDVVAYAFPLARACWLVGAPQIRNRGTVAGNCVTASPANDTITPLWAMDATFTLVSRTRDRVLTCEEFFLGVRQTALRPDEMLIWITVPGLKPTERGTFLKLGLRQAQAISVVNVAAIVEFARAEPKAGEQRVLRARIALGAVAPTIVRAAEAETYLSGKRLTDDVIERAAELAAAAARPISDIRGSAEYRRAMVRVLTARALRQLRDGTEREGWPEQPVLLWGGKKAGGQKSKGAEGQKGRGAGEYKSVGGEIRVILNGVPTTLRGVQGKTLLRALRENAGLTGTKEGCAEGECGACTVWLDGMAVMSCLVPAERADGCEVVTIEGLANLAPPAPPFAGEEQEEQPPKLHPLQQAFIDAGAVQCGYCTPGILMAAANLLAELPRPSPDQIRQALTGNLCRCTGYYKIIEAVERAAQMQSGYQCS